MVDRLAPSTRHKFTHQGRVIYEWDQTFSDVNIYVEVPPGVRGKQLFCTIDSAHVKFGITPNPPYLDVSSEHRHCPSHGCFTHQLEHEFYYNICKIFAAMQRTHRCHNHPHPESKHGLHYQCLLASNRVALEPRLHHMH